ncbi:MAG: hypothetical protein ACRDP9_31210 [Kribbellaceae bacterium]
MTVRVFLLDDHEVVRLGLKQLLDGEPDIEVVGEGATAAQAMAAQAGAPEAEAARAAQAGFLPAEE